MVRKYLLKFNASIKTVDENLVPWKPKFINEIHDFKENPRPVNTELLVNNDIIEQYQIGLAILHQQKIIIITPFSVYFPYAECILCDYNIKLKLSNFCYYSRLACYTVNDDVDESIIKEIKNSAIQITKDNLKLDNITNIYIDTIDNDHLKTHNNITVFKNIMNTNIYPLIWIETNIDKDLCIEDSNGDAYVDKLLPGTPIYSTNGNLFIGILYNHDMNLINIIPTITINKIINGNVLNNIFFDYDINHDDISPINNHTYSLIVTQTYMNTKSPISTLNIGDCIFTINNINILPNGYILYHDIGLNVPLHTYIWYSNKKTHTFDILRNTKYMKLQIMTESLYNKLSVCINTKTLTIEKDNLIFCEPNLLLFEWLMRFNINPNNCTLLQYMENPFYAFKQTFMFVGITNIKNHPETIQQKIKPYIDNIYKPYLYNNDSIVNMELFTILTPNALKILTNDIDKLTICDSKEREIMLEWSC